MVPSHSLPRSVRMFRRPRLFGLAAFLSVTGLAMASRVDTPFGSNTGFKDDSTQLVSLDLTLTSNHSYDYMVANLAPGGFFAGCISQCDRTGDGVQGGHTF